MSKRLDVVGVTGSYTGNDGKEKQRFVRIGAAWVFDDGNMMMSLDAIPVPTPDKHGNHKYHIRTFEPQERNGNGGGGGQRSSGGQQSGGGDFMDDPPPF